MKRSKKWIDFSTISHHSHYGERIFYEREFFFCFLHQRQGLVALFHFICLLSCFFGASWLKAIILFLDFSYLKKTMEKNISSLTSTEMLELHKCTHSTCIIIRWPIPIETKRNRQSREFLTREHIVHILYAMQ